MDGYAGPDDIMSKLQYALEEPCIDLYWGDVMGLLREAHEELKRLNGLHCSRQGSNLKEDT
jgi:hypothetical protein